MNLNKQKWAFYFFVLPLLLFSCGGSSDDPITPPEPPEPPVEVTKGSVSLALDVSTYQPGALEYRFYDASSGQLFGNPLSCDGQGNYNNDKFAIGTYRVLAVNAPVSGVEFQDMDSYANASVYLPASAVNRSGGFTLVSQPGAVYSATVSEVAVSADVPASHVPVPVLLTRSLSLPFTLGDGLGSDVVAVDGILHGLCPSVNLSTGTLASSVSDCENTAVSFSASGDGASRSATVSLFGLCDPQGGVAYTNTLYLTLSFSDGTTEELSVDLTDALTNVLASGDGSLPADVEFPVVEFSRTAIGVLGASVGDWQSGGESQKELQ